MKLLNSVKGQNWPLSDTENIIKISRYFLNIAISRYFQMMQYIAFAIYRDTKRSPLVVTNAELSVGGAAAADPLWLAHRPRLPLLQRCQAHQAGLSHHTGQMLSRNITKPDAVRIEDPAAAPS